MRDKVVFRRRHLPHWDVPGAMYFVTTCLHGSIPAQGLLDVQGYRKELDAQQRPADVPKDEWQRRLDKLEFARVDEWLDLRPAARHLADSRLGRIVCNAIVHFAASRYDVFAYAVMPSHMHWIVRARADWVESEVGKGDRTPREMIMHSLKRFTAQKCNEILAHEGVFWQAESYDHCIRGED